MDNIGYYVMKYRCYYKVLFVRAFINLLPKFSELTLADSNTYIVSDLARKSKSILRFEYYTYEHNISDIANICIFFSAEILIFWLNECTIFKTDEDF